MEVTIIPLIEFRFVAVIREAILHSTIRIADRIGEDRILRFLLRNLKKEVHRPALK
ncbi:MAG: hypothetical protein HFE84_00660 [Lachnospiraceae bacterium]|nr:hypothetical protein [Lachnospiraceae bacterium]